MASAPAKVRLRAYHVGFGDCFLLSFFYEAANARTRHVLIDFGTTSMPKRTPKRTHVHIARQIEEDCDGKLDGLVATHRHADHISGFAGSSGEVIAGLSPTIVLQPWTEDPDLEPDARAPAAAPAGGALGFAAALQDMQQVSDAVGRELTRRGESSRALLDLVAINGVRGFEGISNKKAVEGLIAMGRANHPEWGHHGMKSSLTDELPGVKVTVLGPPTLTQSEKITKQKARDAAEYWHLTARGRQAAARTKRLFPDPPLRQPSAQTAWFRKRIDQLRRDQLFEIVRSVDDSLNNTSLILMFEVGTGAKRRVLLFPGDAQIENWEYALFGPSRDRWEKRLQQVDLYKVGHHGSLNGTPKTLWEGFANRDTRKSAARRLTTVMSTKGRVHGSVSRQTEVPRRTLVDALESDSNHLTTQAIRGHTLFRDVEMNL